MLRRVLESSDLNSKELIKTAPNIFINFLCECLLNGVNGNVPVKKTLIQGHEIHLKSFYIYKHKKLKGRFLLKTRFFKRYCYLVLPSSEEVIMHTEEFTLNPKRMFMSTQPAKSENFDNPIYKQKATQLFLIQRNMFQKPKKEKKRMEQSRQITA